MSNDSGNGETKREMHKLTRITLVYDHETCLVALGLNEVTLALAGMMLHEATVQIDTMRRQAAAMELREQLLEQQKNEEIAAALRKGSGRV